MRLSPFYGILTSCLGPVPSGYPFSCRNRVITSGMTTARVDNVIAVRFYLGTAFG